MSWFCSGICEAENEDKNQLVLINSQTQQTIKYINSTQSLQPNGLQNGFIMLRKSLYDQHLISCQKNNRLFVDQNFPPSQSSLSFNNLSEFPQLKNKNVVWKRISELYTNSQLVQDKIQPADIQQGNVGDCYFLAAISALAQNQSNILQIFQKKTSKQMVRNDFGIYKLVINVAGQPEEVVVDDYIPVMAKSQRPVFCKPVNNQFWVVLLQKAWAKVNKSYANIAQGNPHQVLNRFSVAPVFYHNIFAEYYLKGVRANGKQVDELQARLWQSIIQGHNQNFPMCCGSRFEVHDAGIKASHSYTLLGAYQIRNNNSRHRLLKIRNPWGNTQYSGKYSQNDNFWDRIDSKIKEEIIQKKQNDGIFIMPYNQFLMNFESIDISHCKLNYNYIFKPVSLEDQKAKFYSLIIQEAGQIYITFQTNYQKNASVDSYVQNGVSKVLIAQDIGNGQLQHIDCALQTTLADVTVRCRKLKPGNYIIMIEVEQYKAQSERSLYSTKPSKKGTLSTYSNVVCMLAQVPFVNHFLFQFFKTHAIKSGQKQKKKLSSAQNDWIAKKLMQYSGYGYICLSLDKKGQKKFSISTKRRLIQDQGFKLITQPSSKPSYVSQDATQMVFQVEPGEMKTFLFKIDFKKQDLNLSFPPQGFEIKRII